MSTEQELRLEVENLDLRRLLAQTELTRPNRKVSSVCNASRWRSFIIIV